LRILDEHFGDLSVPRLEMLKLVLGQITSVKEPLSIQALWELTPLALKTALRLRDLKNIVRHLASLLANTHDVDEPIIPFHTSFFDFLCDTNRAHKYLIDMDQANSLLAVGCLEVMERELRFNLCQIPTSYKANNDIENLDSLVRENISRHLLYFASSVIEPLSRMVRGDECDRCTIPSTFSCHQLIKDSTCPQQPCFPCP